MIELKSCIKAQALTQTQTASLFGVNQPRIYDLMRGKIELFGLDMLVNMVGAAGMQIDLHIRKAA